MVTDFDKAPERQKQGSVMGSDEEDGDGHDPGGQGDLSDEKEPTM